MKSAKPSTQPETIHRRAAKMSDSDIYAVQPVPGCGMGLIAKHRMIQGFCIISERPVLTLKKRLSVASATADIYEKLSLLPKAQQVSFFSLSRAPDLNPFFDIVKINCLNAGEGVDDVPGIFLTAARINHSCNPNAYYSWNKQLQLGVVYAMRDIEVGEEITTSYMDLTKNTADRQFDLLNDHHVDCVCRVCSLPEAKRAESDARRDKMDDLKRWIDDGENALVDPLLCLQKAHEIFVLTQAEGLPSSYFAQLYAAAVRIVALHSDRARTRVFSQRALRERMICHGPGHTKVKELRKVLESPSAYDRYRVTLEWASSASDIPRSLNEERFEEWLWRKKEWPMA